MSENPEHDQPMPLVSHLTELRTRLLRCVAVIFLIFAGLFSFAQQIYTGLRAARAPAGQCDDDRHRRGLAVPHAVQADHDRLAVLAIPFILQQIWGFIAPGLYRHEKRIAIPLLVSSIFLFYAGMAFAYFWCSR